MSKAPRIVRRDLKGQIPSGYALARLDRGDGPAQFVPMTDLRDALLGPGGLGRYIAQQAAANAVPAPGGYDPFAAKIPALANWTVFGNAGLTTSEATPASSETTAIRLSGVYATTDNKIMGIHKAAPTPPYIIAAFVTGAFLDSFNSIGMGWYDGTKLATWNIMGRQGGSNVAVNRFNYSNPTTFAGGSNIFNLPSVYSYGLWLGIENDGTNIRCGILPNGVDFLPLTTETVAGGYLGPSGWDDVCFYISPSANPIPVSPLFDFHGLMLCWDENGANRSLTSVYG